MMATSICQGRHWAILRDDEFLVGSPVPIAWVTHDLDTTETALTGLLGVKKWVRTPDAHFAPDTCSYLGRPVDFVVSISLSYLGDMQLELVTPVGGPNIYSDFLRHISAEIRRFSDYIKQEQR
jgi:hypothetical protein